MNLLRKHTKVVAIFLLINAVQFVFGNSVAYALTSGPSAPEATSFEPIDTSDMVNLNTGDFTYNIPLIEVPGPAGGYPLGLSYHAGIQPLEDASWVGLGWTLNPGALNRFVRGTPDDWNGTLNTDRVYWAGGRTNTFSIGLSLSVAGVVGVSGNLAISNDTYKGYGTGGSVGLDISVTKELEVLKKLSKVTKKKYKLSVGGNVGISVSHGPYAESDDISTEFHVNAIAGLSDDKKTWKKTASIGWSTSKGLNYSQGISVGLDKTVGLSSKISASTKKGIQGSADLSYITKKGTSFPLTGVSISATGGKASTSIGGVSSVNSSSLAGNMSTTSKGFSFPIPIWPGVFSLSIGWDQQRYWIDETEHSNLFGGLYQPSANIASKEGDFDFFDNNSFDSYTTFDQSQESIDLEKGSSHDFGLAFMNYDNYMVNAQGIGGSIQPYHFQQYTPRKNLREVEKKEVKKFLRTETEVVTKRFVSTDVTPMKDYDNKLQFRFMNDFSNKYKYDSPDFTATGNKINKYDFESVLPETGLYREDINKLVSSRAIRYFTNQEILNGESFKYGFIDTKATGFVRRGNDDTRKRYSKNGDKIGGFMITNETGVTYHFALPAYNYREYQESKNRDNDFDIKNYSLKIEQYAYTWYLTAVTGPDYVDRNNDGYVNPGDWGYWVEFDYGKWSDVYKWRNPFSGAHIDIDANFENFSSGLKELYYLDAIKTASHTALFIKSPRNDSKSRKTAPDFEHGASILDQGQDDTNNRKWKDDFVYHYDEMSYNCECHYQVKDEETGLNLDVERATLSYKLDQVQVMKLDKIVLMKNNLIQDALDKTKGNEFSNSVPVNWVVHYDNSNNLEVENKCDHSVLTSKTFVYHEPKNVLDIGDFGDNLSEVLSRSVESIDFQTNYSLRNGALTLNSIQQLGPNGAIALPKTIFGYGCNPRLPQGSTKKYVDSWGMYKSSGRIQQCGPDAGALLDHDNKHHDHYHAWSLDHIRTGTGGEIKIKYQPDEFKTAVYGGKVMSVVGAEIFDESTNTAKITFSNYHDTRPYRESPKTNFVLKSMLAKEFTDVLVYDYEADDSNPVIGTRDVSAPSAEYAFEEHDVIKIVTGETLGINEFLVTSPNLISALKQSGTNQTSEIPWSSYQGPLKNMFTAIPVGYKSIVRRQYKNTNRTLVAGGIEVEVDKTEKGSGLRVKSLSIDDPFRDVIHTTYYDYSDPNDADGETSGYTSYIPMSLPRADFKFPDTDNYKEYKRYYWSKPSLTCSDCYEGLVEVSSDFNLETIDQKTSEFDGVRYKKLLRQISLTPHLPAPGAMYGYVTTSESVTVRGVERFNPYKSRHEFQVFHKGMLGTIRLSGNETNPTFKHKLVAMKDFTLSVGELKSITLLDEHDRKVSKSVYHFLHDDAVAENVTNDDPNIENDFEALVDIYEPKLSSLGHNGINGDQGVIHETFVDGKIIHNTPLGDKRYYSAVRLEKYPSVNVGETHINYKTGSKTRTDNISFDFYTGSVTQNMVTDDYGNKYITEILPAYSVDYGETYVGMGLKDMDYKKKNMLAQTAASYTYKVNPEYIPHSGDDWKSSDNLLAAIGGTADTWSTEIPNIQAEKLTIEISSYLPGQATIKWPYLNRPLNVGDKFDVFVGSTVFKARVNAFFGNFNDDNLSYSIKFLNQAPSLTSSYSSYSIEHSGVYQINNNYSFIGIPGIGTNRDGSYPLENFSEFNNWTGVQETIIGWQTNSAITLVDKYSHILEKKDVNGQFLATKMNMDHVLVKSTVANASYNEFAFSGAEERRIRSGDIKDLGGGIIQPHGSRIKNSTESHTGDYYIRTTGGGKAFEFTTSSLHKGRSYLVQVWTTNPNGLVIDSDQSGMMGESHIELGRAEGTPWYLVERTFQPTESSLLTKIWVRGTTGNNIRFDDFRVVPNDAAMSSYIYDPITDRLVYILGADHTFSRYEYDAAGRLIDTYKESLIYGIKHITRNSIDTAHFERIDPVKAAKR